MKIILFSRPKAISSSEDIDAIFSAIERYGFDYTINSEMAEELATKYGRTIDASKIYTTSVGKQNSDAVMVCYGGDGTLLEGVHRLKEQDIPVVGINSGRLGFLALASREHIGEVFASIDSGDLRIEQRTMLRVEGKNIDGDAPVYALNEIAVQRLGATMIAIDVAIDGEKVATLNGDGVIIATPTGSTAYSLSAGGPIVSPRCQCIVLTPLSPHNLSMRPIVMSDSRVLSLRVRTRSNTASVSIDNHVCEVPDGAEFTIQSAEHTISLAVPHNITLFDTLRDKMMWGVDAR